MPRLILSANEVEATVKRAVQGAGWSHGLAAQAGGAALALCQHGGDGAGAVLAALTEKLGTATAARRPHGWDIFATPILAAGPSIFELLETAPDGQVHIRGDAVSDLLVGYGLLAARAFGATYRIECADGSLDIPAPGRMALPRGPLQITRGATASTAPVPPTALDIDAATWAALCEAATKAYVPATEASRASGAGAGLTDND